MAMKVVSMLEILLGAAMVGVGVSVDGCDCLC